MLVYLAGPVDSDDGNGRTSRAIAKELLHKAGFTTFDPGRAFEGPTGDSAPDICAIDTRLASTMEFFLAILPVGVRTCGTPVEIDRRRSYLMELGDLPIVPRSVIICDQEMCFLWGYKVVGTMEEAVAHLINERG